MDRKGIIMEDKFNMTNRAIDEKKKPPHYKTNDPNKRETLRALNRVLYYVNSGNRIHSLTIDEDEETMGISVMVYKNRDKDGTTT